MAISATIMNEYRYNYAQSNLDKHEHRGSRYGAIEAYMGDTSNLLPAFMDIVNGRKSAAIATKVPVIQRDTFTLNAARTCSVVTKDSTSALVTITWATIQTGFSMVPSDYVDNEIAYQQDFTKKIERMQHTIKTQLDTLAVASLEANKAPKNNADGNPYTVAGDTMQIPKADEEHFINELPTIMQQNDLYDSAFKVVGSPRLGALLRFLGAQGAGNDENAAYQLNGFDWYLTNRVVPSAGMRDAFYIFPSGSVAFLPWVDFDARANHKSTDGKEWSEQFLPILGFNVGLVFQSSCIDNHSAHTGMEATLKESWSFSFDYALVTAYNSDSVNLPGAIYKGELASV